jgi:alkyl hydroperoxide reductase subunit D
MLADIKRELSQSLGILDKAEGVCLRATFIVDPDGIIRFVSVNDLSVGRNPQEVLRVLDALQTDELCPCNWQKGDDVLKDRLPEYARDLKLNLSSLASEQLLSPQQKAGSFIAAALAADHAPTTRDLVDAFGGELSPEALNAAKIAASLMAMNNIYYRFVHLVHAADYKTLPAKLRMTAMAKPGVDKVDFELWSLAVAAVNGCGRCLTAHEHELRGRGVTREVIQDAIRVASVVHAVAVTIEALETSSGIGQIAVAV